MFKSFIGSVRDKMPSMIIHLGDGINQSLTPFEIKDSELTDISNMTSRDYPACSVIPGRAEYASDLTTPNGLGQRNNADLHVLDGTSWNYWNGAAWVVVQAGLTSATAKFVEFSTGTTKYTIMANGTNAYSWSGEGAAASLTEAPLSKLVTTHKGRVYWARANDIIYSALNLINDYTTAHDAGTIDVTRAKGAITAITEFDKVVLWTEYGMHELYGTNAGNYDLVDLQGNVGCISDRSVVKCNSALYWAWYDGIYAYSGGVPRKISTKIENYFKKGESELLNFTYKTKIVSGFAGNYLYFSVPSGAATENNKILVYDTKRDIWNTETGAFVDFATIANFLYGVDSDGKLWNMESGTTFDGTAIPWSITSKAFIDGGVRRKKTLSDLWMVVDLPTGSTMVVSYSATFDNEDFATLYTFSVSANEQNARIQVPVDILQDINWYRLRISGTGPATIYYLDKSIRIKTR